MKIFVSRKMIKNGARKSATLCPLGLAFLAEGFDVSVGPDHVDFYQHGIICGTLPLPRHAQHFQKSFDDGKPVGPFDFEMPGLESGVVPQTDFRSIPVTSPVSAIRNPRSAAFA